MSTTALSSERPAFRGWLLVVVRLLGVACLTVALLSSRDPELILAAVAMIAIGWFPFVFEITASAAAALSLIDVVAAIYGEVKIVPLDEIAILLLSAALLVACAEDTWVFVLLADSQGGHQARRLFAAGVLFPIAFGWLRLEGELRDFYDARYGVALIVSATIIGISAAVIWTSRHLHFEDRRRQRAENELRVAFDVLKARLGETTNTKKRDLSQLAEQLAHANAEMEAFSYSVSHDLRAPLRAIDGFSRQLLEHAGAQQLDDEQRHYLKRIRAGSQKMGTLIDDLLRLSRVARFEIQLRPVDVTKLAQEVIAELREHDPQREVGVEIAPGLTAMADVQLLRVALTNLLGNAWKFTSKVESPHIEVGQVDGAFLVRDNGVGFDTQYAGRLFGAFQRLHSPTEFEGTGIGLAIVQRIVHRHGGRIWAEAEPGRGATFFFTLGGAG